MTPTKIADRLEISIGLDGAPRPLMAAIDIELRVFFGVTPIQAAERAEAVANAVARLIADRGLAAERAGIIPKLTMLGSTSDVVAGCCHVLPDDLDAVATAKRHRLQVDALLEAMRDLTFNEFEKFSARVLAELGATFYRITPHSGDQGIDFYGRLSLGEFQALPTPFAQLAHDVVLLFAGQAKHYPRSALGTDIVRELVGAVTLARIKTFSTDGMDMFPGLDLKPLSALITLLFSTGRLTSGAVKLAEAAGIVARSGEQIALFLADKGVGMRASEAGPVFDPAAFREWLSAE